MGKLMRRSELQDKYDGVLQWGIPRDISIRISDYQRQDTILEWVVDNFDFFCDISFPSVWLEFLKYVEKHPDLPLMEMLDTFMDGYPLLHALKDQQFWALVRLLKVPRHEWPVEMREEIRRIREERNSDALCWTCTNLDYDPIYDTLSQSTQDVPVAGLFTRKTSIIDQDPDDKPRPISCNPLPVCPVRGVVLHKGYKHCSNYSKGDQTSRLMEAQEDK